MASEQDQLRAWQDQLPDDLTVGRFEPDFDINGVHYQYGAWNSAGEWWLCWNTESEFQEQLASLEIPEEDEEQL
jgi:hypothetical protein